MFRKMIEERFEIGIEMLGKFFTVDILKKILYEILFNEFVFFENLNSPAFSISSTL